jgi:large subunit ribosomal protein L23
MSIIGTIKKKISKQEGSTRKKEASEVRAKKASDTAETSGRAESAQGRPVYAGRVIESPYITEKTAALAAHNTYVFKVARATTKNEIVKAIQRMFKVTVMKVNVMTMPGKKVRVGKHEGRVPGFKKAMVTIKEGETIDIGV